MILMMKTSISNNLILRLNNINYEANTFCEKLNIDDRLQQMEETEAFITVKDHKDGFLIHYRLGLLIHSNLILVK